MFYNSSEWFRFICPVCNLEHGAYINNFITGDSCPYCNDRLVMPGYNSFGDKHPDLVAEMDMVANYLLPKSPFDVSDTSDYKFWFICKNNQKHKYPMSPRARLMFKKRDKEPCLYCKGQRRKLNHFVPNDKKP